MLISQARNNILKVFQSLKLTTYNVLVTGDIGPYNEWFYTHLSHQNGPFFAIAYISG